MLGATNRPEVLDPALLRPGRFDRRVAVQPPDRDGRARRSSRCTRARSRSPTTSTSTRSPRRTPGMVGADLANLANEAALLAARRGHEKVEMADFTDSLEKILLGAPRGILLCAGRPRAHRLPRVRPRARRDAHARAPTRSARCRSSRAGWRSA